MSDEASDEASDEVSDQTSDKSGKSIQDIQITDLDKRGVQSTGVAVDCTKLTVPRKSTAPQANKVPPHKA